MLSIALASTKSFSEWLNRRSLMYVYPRTNKEHLSYILLIFEQLNKHTGVVIYRLVQLCAFIV